MAKYQLLTRQAQDAIDWTMNRLPEAGFQEFQREMEIVLARTLRRYGVTDDVMQGFDVQQLVADREPLDLKPEGPKTIILEGDRYACNEGIYFQSSSGSWFAQNPDRKWQYLSQAIPKTTKLVLLEQHYRIIVNAAECPQAGKE